MANILLKEDCMKKKKPQTFEEAKAYLDSMLKKSKENQELFAKAKEEALKEPNFWKRKYNIVTFKKLKST